MPKQQNFLKVVTMKLKDHYSLYVEHLQSLNADLPSFTNTIPNFPTVQEVQNDITTSLDILEAFGNYLIERNRSKSLERRVHTAEKAVDFWYETNEKERQERLHTAEVRFQSFIEEVKAKNRNELQQAIFEAHTQAKTMDNERYAAHSHYRVIREILENYKEYLVGLDQQLDSLKANASADVHNLYFQRLEDDYMKKIRKIQKYLKYWR